MSDAESPVLDGTVRVAIIEDDRQTRGGLRFLIDNTPGYRCLWDHGSVEDALRSSKGDPPDVLLLDIHLPGIGGDAAVPKLRGVWPSVEILMLTVFVEEDRVFQSICNGASGYLLKKTPPDRLLQAIREAHDGGAPMSPEIARKVVDLFRKTGAPTKPEAELTAQERRLLALLAQGYRYQAAGDELHISVNTVRNYVRSIYEKLHVHSKSEAVSKAIRQRLIG